MEEMLRSVSLRFHYFEIEIVIVKKVEHALRCQILVLADLSGACWSDCIGCKLVEIFKK